MFMTLMVVGIPAMSAAAMIKTLASMKKTATELEWKTQRLTQAAYVAMACGKPAPSYAKQIVLDDELRKLADDYYTL